MKRVALNGNVFALFGNEIFDNIRFRMQYIQFPIRLLLFGYVRLDGKLFLNYNIRTLTIYSPSSGDDS